MEAIALPEPLRHLRGRIVDVDSHEMIPAQRWPEVFGPEVQELTDAILRTGTDRYDRNSSNVPDYPGDVVEITEKVLNFKGTKAPGAVDLARRLEVMDAMGAARQLMFPTSVGIWALGLLMFDRYDPRLLGDIAVERAEKAKRWLQIYNQWMVRQCGVSDRIRPVPPLVGDTVPELFANARALLDAGARAVWLPPSALPGGKSPAHPDLEAFWSLLEDRDCTIALHLGTEAKFFESLKGWRDAPAFEGYRTVAELSNDPWYLNSMHFPTQNFIQTMVLGGVFMRHPRLRVGTIEVGGFWVGPMMEQMDMWHQNLGAFGRPQHAITELPSTYVRQNVRVAVFSFEDITGYLEHHRRYGLDDVLCFSSDYPHAEGGQDMLNVMYSKVAPFGPEAVEKFFVTNGDFLVPP